jgi:uncharacterized RDD family membrane protein YckC
LIRKLLPLLVIGGALALLWESLEPPPPAPRPFLAVVEAGETDVLVRSVEPGPAGGPTRFSIGPLDGPGPAEVRHGLPRAAAGLPDGRVTILFDGGAAFLKLSSGEGASEETWTRVSFPERDLTPLAAASVESARVVFVGRRPEEPGKLCVGVLEDGGSRWLGESLPLHDGARDVLLLSDGDRVELVWRESSSEGTRVRTRPLWPEVGEPRLLTSARGIRALAAAGRDLLVLYEDGRLRREGPGIGDPREGRLDGLPEGPIRLAATTGERGRLLALSVRGLATWTLDDQGLPTGEVAGAESEAPLVWLLGAVAALSALVIVALILFASRRTEPVEEVGLSPAPLWQRLAAWALDFFLVAPLVLLALLEGLDLPGDAVLPGGPFPDATLGEANRLALLTQVLVLAYFVVAESIRGQTLGKWALGIRTVRLDGSRVGVLAVLVRNVLRVLVDQYGGILLAVLSRRKQRVGDWLAKTMVVRTRTPRRKAPPGRPSE